MLAVVKATPGQGKLPRLLQAAGVATTCHPVRTPKQETDVRVMKPVSTDTVTACT